MYHSYCFEYGIAWPSLEQGKKLQYFLLDRVAKFTSLCLEQSLSFEILSRLNPPTQIPVEYNPIPGPDPPRINAGAIPTVNHDRLQHWVGITNLEIQQLCSSQHGIEDDSFQRGCLSLVVISTDCKMKWNRYCINSS